MRDVIAFSMILAVSLSVTAFGINAVTAAIALGGTIGLFACSPVWRLAREVEILTGTSAMRFYLQSFLHALLAQSAAVALGLIVKRIFNV